MAHWTDKHTKKDIVAHFTAHLTNPELPDTIPCVKAWGIFL